MSNKSKQELVDILIAAESALSQLDKGKTYSSSYIVGRFLKAAELHSTDQLIGNMRDVLIKKASKNDFINQNEIGSLYNEMYGLSGGQTAFRDVLGDLLPDSLQLKKVAYPGSKTRALEENKLEPIYKDSELSDAFSVLFSLGGDSFGTYKPNQNKDIEKVVISKLSSLGHTPIGVDIVETNEHYALCATTHQTGKLNKVSVYIPVQITDGVVKSPEFVVSGENVLELTARNLFTTIKEQSRNQTVDSNRRFASERGDGSKGIEVSKSVVPTSLEYFADLENTLVAAASNFDSNKVKMAIAMLDGELASLGVKNSQIKIAGSDNKSILFDVFIPTKLGSSLVKIPVEIVNNVPLLPTKFSSHETQKDLRIFKFNSSGFQEYFDNLNSKSESIKIARITGELSTMSYHQLMDQIIEGITSNDFKKAEDSLQTIENRFGSDKFMVAFDKYSQLLRHVSSGGKRKEQIKAAYERGDLIKVSNSIHLYCPKLGLPVTKVSFDEKGRVIPMSRSKKSENQIQETLISNSKIVLT
jgi:hypothetical protein